MMLVRKAAALALSAALLGGSALALTPAEAFPSQKTYPGYADVAAGTWYADSVQVCYEIGLMVGTDTGFAPQQVLTVGEVAAIAARMNEAITGDSIPMATPKPGETLPWYFSYMTYLEQQGIDVPDPTRQATRQEFVDLLSAVVPEDMLSPINAITTLPDTSDPSVLAFYNAGILAGVDPWGTFAPDKTLTRAECAAMVARIARPALRLSFTPADYTPFTAAGLKPSDVLFAAADKTVTAGEYLPHLLSLIDGLETACAEGGTAFRWDNTLNGDETYRDYVLRTALQDFGVTAGDGTALYERFDVEDFYHRYLHPEESPAQQPEDQEYTLYVGQAGDFVPFSTHSALDPAAESSLLVEHLLTEMSALTGWNLDASAIYVGKGGVTIAWAETSALFVGPPEQQKPGFHVYDSTQLAFSVLDSVQRTVQCAFSPENPEALDVWFCGPDEGALVLKDLGVTLPVEEPYSHTLLEGLLSH